MVTEAKREKPDGPADETCPLWQKQCSDVCRTCKHWLELELRDEEGHITGHGYECAHVITAQGTMRTAKEVRGVTHATNATTNRVAELHNGMARPNMQLIEQLKPILQATGGIPPIAPPRADPSRDAPKLIGERAIDGQAVDGEAIDAKAHDAKAFDGPDHGVEATPPEKTHGQTDPARGSP